MMMKPTENEFDHLYSALMPALSKAAVGNFESDIEVDASNSQRINELLMGVEVLFDVIREQTIELEALKAKVPSSNHRAVTLLDEVLQRPLE